MKRMTYCDSLAALVLVVFFLCSLLKYYCSLLTGSSVDHYRESASVSHTTNAGFYPAKQSWEFLPGGVHKVGNI